MIKKHPLRKALAQTCASSMYQGTELTPRHLHQAAPMSLDLSSALWQWHLSEQIIPTSLGSE